MNIPKVQWHLDRTADIRMKTTAAYEKLVPSQQLLFPFVDQLQQARGPCGSALPAFPSTGRPFETQAALRFAFFLKKFKYILLTSHTYS